MVSTLNDLKSRGMEEVLTRLYRIGYTPKSLEEAQRDTLWWIYARAQAALNRRTLDTASGIAWTGAGYAELVPIEVPRPGKGRVSVRIESSAISPGTERAQYLKLPNTAVGILGRPGYSSAGIVRAVGRNVYGIRPGDRVAVTGVAHASLATVTVSQVFPIPDSISFEAASLIQLGVICRQGVRLAGLDAGQEFAVVGAGPIGALALRLAAINATPRAVIATTTSKESAARRGGAQDFLTTVEDAARIEGLNAPVVFEATGNPEALSVAAAAAGRGGRIVLLGSPRGVTANFPLELFREKRLEIVGAHVDTVDIESEQTGEDLRRRHGETFLQQLVEHELFLEDLIGPGIDPREASLFYKELTERLDQVGAHFDWSLLPNRERVTSGHLLRAPNVLGRGMDAKRPIRRRPSSTNELFELGNQFDGASGNLRLGLIGCGDIAVHNATGIAVAPNCRLVACFDPVRRLAEDLAKKYGAVATGSVEELLDRSDVDAVVVSVPHYLHAPVAETAIAAGKHVVVEKPLANTLESAVQMNCAAEAAGVALSVCFPQRYDPSVVISRRLIERGAIGRFEGATIRLYLDKSPAYWLGGFSGRIQSHWRRSKQGAGGGVLIMNLSHHVDLIRHLGRVEADTVLATGGAMNNSAEIEDSISVGIRFDNGAVGNLSGFSSVRGTTHDEIGLWGETGHVMVMPEPRVYSLRAIPGLRTSRWQTYGTLPPPRIRAVFFTRLGTAISEGFPPDVTGRDGIAVQAVIEAAYRSMESESSERPIELIADVSA